MVVHGDRVEEDGRDGGVLRPGLHFSALTGMDGETLDRLLDGKFFIFQSQIELISCLIHLQVVTALYGNVDSVTE